MQGLSPGWWGVLALAATGCGSGLAVSTSRQPVPEPEVTVEVRAASVLVDGVEVSDVPSALQQAAADARASAVASGATFQGRVAVSAQGDLRADRLVQVLSVASGAGLQAPWLVVQDPGGTRWGIPVRLPAGRAATALSSGAAPTESGSRKAAGFANPVLRVLADGGYTLSVRDEVVDPGRAGVALPCEDPRCSPPPAHELNRLVRRIKLDHPKDRAIMVVPDRSVKLQDLVTAMDASRDDALTAQGSRTLLPEVLLGLRGPE